MSDEHNAEDGHDGDDKRHEDGSADDTSRTGDPLEDLRRDVEQRGSDDESTTDEAADVDPFTEMSVDEIDAETVWADVLGEDDLDPESVAAAGFDAGDDGRFQIVNKQLCHRCQYFGDPPTLHCTHDGTQIHELEDMDHYRVSACPMVETGDESPE